MQADDVTSGSSITVEVLSGKTTAASSNASTTLPPLQLRLLFVERAT